MQGLIQWTPGVTLESIEQQVIEAAYNHYQKNKTATSNALGISIRTLDSKLDKYKLDAESEAERQADEHRKREEFLARSRGQVPNNVNGDPVTASIKAAEEAGRQRGHGADAGVRVESASDSAAKSQVPVSERPKVQTVLPKQAAQGHSIKSR